jgi:hypothetical protein
VLNAIEAGRIFIREGTVLPKTLQIESEPYMSGWRSVESVIFQVKDKHFDVPAPRKIELRPDQSIGLSVGAGLPLDEIKMPNLESIRI